VHAELGAMPEAAKVIQDAKGEFFGTPAHAQIVIVDSNLALKRGDVHTALSLLKGVSPESPHYIKAKMAAANIHLNHRHDRKTYLRYFQDLVAKNADSVAMQCLLAEAHMKLQDPASAVEAYQKARSLEEKQGASTDSDLAAKIGRAFISSHDFSGAIQYLQVNYHLYLYICIYVYMYVCLYTYAS
jgi:tetratricopeptide repeat protein 21B